MPEAVLALDQGTTGSTARVFAHDGAVLGHAYAEFTQHYPRPGWVEHDPEEIWQVSLRVMREALESCAVKPRKLRALGLTNQRETTVVWDRRTGQPLQRAIVWQSRQTAEICAALKAAGHEPLFRERTGLVLDPYFSGSKLRFLLDLHPDAQAKAAAGELIFGTIDSWLIFKLTGGRVHATEPTNASRTLLFDIHTRRWEPELCGVLGVPAAMLPEVRPSSGYFGETALEGALPSGVPICGVAGDQQAALYGQGCWEPGQAKNTYGTGCFVVLNLGEKATLSTQGLITTLACGADGRPVYALEGSVFVAGAALQWLRDELGLIQHAAESEALARSVPDTAGVYLVPAFAGLGAPYWDAGARGALVGLTRGANRKHVVRAALESLAYQSHDVIAAMQRESGVALKELRVDGGAAANDFLMQFQADVSGVPVDRPLSVETTVLGAAYLAGLAAGFWSSPEELRGVRQRERLFEPQLDPAARVALLAGWQAAVARVRS